MQKKTLVLAGILVVLIGVVYAYQGPIKTWRENLGKPNNFLAGLDTGRIDKIELGGKNPATLVKQNGDWLVEGMPGKFKVAAADMSDVMAALDKATKSEVEFTSTNKEKKKDFQTDADGGVRVTLYNGQIELVRLVVGKLASDFQSTYISQPEIDSTYLLKGVSLSYLFLRDDWRDRTIFSGDKEKIKKLRLKYPGREFVLERDDKGEWRLSKPYAMSVKKEKLEKILALMSGLTAVAIPEQDFKPTGLDKNLLIAEATGEGLSNVLMVGNDNGKGQFYAKRGDSDNIYLISEDDKNGLDIKIDQLK